MKIKMALKTRVRSLAVGFVLIFLLSACEDITPISQPTFTPLLQPILTALPQPSVAASTENATEEPLPSHPAQPTEVPAPEVSSIPEVTQLLPEAPISALAELPRLASDDASLSNLALTLLMPHSRPIRERAQLKRIASRLNNPTITPTADEYRVVSVTPPLPIPGGSCKSRIKIGALSLAAVAGFSAFGIHNEWLNNGISRLSDATITNWNRLGDYIPQCADVTAINIRDSYCALVNQGAKYWGPNSFCEGGDGITTDRLTSGDQTEANLAVDLDITSSTPEGSIQKIRGHRVVFGAFYIPGETLVRIKDTSRKGFRFAPIDSIREGDSVSRCNSEINGRTCKFRVVREVVTRTFKHIITLTSDQGILKVTRHHRFYVINKGWLSARELKLGDMIKSFKGQVFKIDEIKREKGDFKVFNLYVDAHPNDVESKLLDNNGVIFNEKADSFLDRSTVKPLAPTFIYTL